MADVLIAIGYVPAVEPLWNQRFNGEAEKFVTGALKHAFRFGIGEHDLAAFIHLEDGIGSRFEDERNALGRERAGNDLTFGSVLVSYNLSASRRPFRTIVVSKMSIRPSVKLVAVDDTPSSLSFFPRPFNRMA
jgi:hypothetical protein